MTYDEWFEKYEPVLGEDNNYVEVEFDDPESITLNLLNRRIWTDLGYYIVPGARFVNRIRYLVTKNPWSESDFNNSEVEVSE